MKQSESDGAGAVYASKKNGEPEKQDTKVKSKNKKPLDDKFLSQEGGQQLERVSEKGKLGKKEEKQGTEKTGGNERDAAIPVEQDRAVMEPDEKSKSGTSKGKGHRGPKTSVEEGKEKRQGADGPESSSHGTDVMSSQPRKTASTVARPDTRKAHKNGGPACKDKGSEEHVISEGGNRESRLIGRGVMIGDDRDARRRKRKREMHMHRSAVGGQNSGYGIQDGSNANKMLRAMGWSPGQGRE
jgi:hypothetical protein